jgi:hypothetical protein
MDDLQKEIDGLTERLRKEKPELYKHLNETPVTIPNEADPDMETFLKQHAETLRQWLNN